MHSFPSRNQVLEQQSNIMQKQLSKLSSNFVEKLHTCGKVPHWWKSTTSQGKDPQSWKTSALMEKFINQVLHVDQEILLP